MKQVIEISVYIDNVLQPLEFDGTESLVISKGVANVGEPDVILSTIAYTFDLPKTDRNAKVLQYAGYRGATNSVVKQRIKAQVKLNGFILFPTCLLVIREISDKYKCNVMSDGSLFLDQIKGNSIQDIDFNDFQYSWTLVDAPTYVSGMVISPCIHTGCIENNLYSGQYDINHIIPAVSFADMFDRLFLQQYNSALDRDFIHTSIVNNDANNLQYITLLTTNLSTEQQTNIKAIVANYNSNYSFTGSGTIFLDLTSVTSNSYGIASTANDTYTVPVDGTYTFSITYSFNTAAFTDLGAYLDIFYPDGTPLGSRGIASWTNSNSTTGTATIEIFLRQNEYVKIRTDLTLLTPPNVLFVYVCTLQCTSCPTVNHSKLDGTFSGFYLTISNNLANISQIDFLKYYLQLNQAFITFDLPNSIIITPFSEFMTKFDSGIVNDLSDYFLYTENVAFSIELAKENWIKYTTDSIDGDIQTSWYKFTTTTGEGEKTLYTAPFAASLPIELQSVDYQKTQRTSVTTTSLNIWQRTSTTAITSGDLVPNKFYVVADLGTGGGMVNSNIGGHDQFPDQFLATGTTPTNWSGGIVYELDYQRKGFITRNFILTPVDSGGAASPYGIVYTDYRNWNGSANVNVIFDDIPTANFTPLQFDNLIDADWLSQLQDVERYTVICRLPENVFFNIDLSKPTYFKQLGFAMFVEKIENYRGGWESCKIVGIKLQP